MFAEVANSHAQASASAMTLHRLSSSLFGQDCRLLEVAVHRLIDPPPASLVEADRHPSCRHPQQLITLRICPLSRCASRSRPRPDPRRSRRTIMPSSHGERSRRSSMSNRPRPTAPNAPLWSLATHVMGSPLLPASRTVAACHQSRSMGSGACPHSNQRRSVTASTRSVLSAKR
jgi:hypothetical protein